MKPFDFVPVIDFIRSHDGFRDYAAPLGPSIPNGYEQSLKNPTHPTDKAYEHGPAIIDYAHVDIPQELIDAQHKSFRDALNIYMRPSDVTAFMCGYFQGDFLSNPHFLVLMEKPIPEQYSFSNSFNSFDFDDEERPNVQRKYYTSEEFNMHRHICKTVPEIRMSVLAYQSGFLAYLSELRTVMDSNANGGLTVQERERGLLITDRLSENWSSENFSSELLPAMCLAYYQRDSSLTSPPQIIDFQNGFDIASKLGLFKRHVYRNGKHVFVCPAGHTIRSVSMSTLDDEVCGRFVAGQHIGSIMGAIYERIRNDPFRPADMYRQGLSPAEKDFE